MNFKTELRRLLKGRVVIRHRSSEEREGTGDVCCVCSRKISMLPGNLCVAVGNEGLLCSVCTGVYAPEMATALGDQLPVTIENTHPVTPGLSMPEWIEIAKDISTLQSISAELAKGISRGIVEAPVGHIGLLHYAKDIQKPQRKEHESDKEYDMRVKTHRMTKLYETLYSETTGRVEKIKKLLLKHGLPPNLF